MSAGGPTSGQGVTVIADRVVIKIATRAAAEVEQAHGAGRTPPFLGVGGSRRARAWVRVDGGVVAARVELSVVYPASIPAVTRQARERIRERVESLTGLRVSHVDIDVTALRPPAARRGARAR